MKKTFLAVMAALALTAGARAQEGERPGRPQPSREEMLRAQTDRMAEELGLDDAQKASVLQLNAEYAGKLPRPAMRRRGGEGVPEEFPDSLGPRRPDKEEMDAMMEELRGNMESYNAGLRKILTDEQYAKYEESLKRRGRPGGEPGPGGRPGGPQTPPAPGAPAE